MKIKNVECLRNTAIERFRQNVWPARYMQSRMAFLAKILFPTISDCHLEFLRKMQK